MATFGCSFNHYDLFALKYGKINILSSNSFYFEFMDRIHCLRFGYP